MSNSRLPTLCVVVPATDEAPTIDRCLDAIRSGVDRPDEIFIQREPRSAGPAEARNRAATRVESDVILFVDADVEVHADAISRVRQKMSEPTLAAVFGSYDNRPADPGIASRFRNLLHHHVHATEAGNASTFWAGLGAVRRDVFLDAGGFDDEKYSRPSIEDVELGMRLHRSGARIELDPAIQGTHLKRWTTRSFAIVDFRDRALPWARLLIRRRGTPKPLNLGFKHRASALLSATALAAAVTRKPRAVTGCVAGLLVLNRDFYLLLARRGGIRLASIGVVLHAVHHLVALAALPVAAATEAGQSLWRRHG